MKIDSKKWLPLSNAAAHVGVSERTIGVWYLSGNLTAIDPWCKDIGRLYSVKDLEDIAASSKRLITRRKKRLDK